MIDYEERVSLAITEDHEKKDTKISGQVICIEISSSSDDSDDLLVTQ